MATTSKTEQVVDIGKLIARKPGVRGGRPHVVGAGVTVRRIVGMRYWAGLTPEQIAGEMPHLDMAGIYAALAFYHANQAQMDSEFAADEVEDDKLEEEWLRSKTHA